MFGNPVILRAQAQRISSLFPFFFLLTSFSAAEIHLPSDLITLDKICNEYRSVLNLKLQEMRRTFTLKEVEPGEIQFLDSEQIPQATLHLFQTMNPEKTKKIEKVRLTNPKSEAIIEETTTTIGHNLEFVDAQNLIFFESYSNAGHSHCSCASTNESQKEVQISLFDNPLFKFLVENGSVNIEQLYLGPTHVVTIQEISPTQTAKKRFEYIIHAGDYRVQAPHFNWSWGGIAPGKLWLTGTQEKNFILPNFKYYSQFKSNRGLRGDLSLNEFLNETNERIYMPFVKNGILGMLDIIVAHIFPRTERSANVAASNRFLDELHLLRKQVDDAQTNPSLLIQVKAKLLEFIGAIQDGSLQANYTK